MEQRQCPKRPFLSEEEPVSSEKTSLAQNVHVMNHVSDAQISESANRETGRSRK